MEKLLKIASAVADQAEVYWIEQSKDKLSFTDGKADSADTSLSSGIALRLINKGKMGLAHTCNLLDPEKLVKQALLATENGTEANFELPHTTDLPVIESYSPEIESMSKQDLMQTGKELLSYIQSRVKGQVNLGFNYGTASSGLLNSKGTILSGKYSGFYAHAELVFAGSGSGLHAFKAGVGPQKLDYEMLDEMIELFRIAENQEIAPTKRMPVIFTPMSLHALLSRLETAINPQNIYNQISPLCGRLGEQIISNKISIYQDPHNAEISGASSYDSEGTPTQKLYFFENGIYKAYPTDLNYAAKLKVKPSGNAVRGSYGQLPAADLLNMMVPAGDKTLDEMISSIDEGIIVQSLMGAHSGNVLNGDFSVGVSTGFMIKNGKLVARLKDTMLSGNVYETLNKVVALEDKVLKMGGTWLPSMLIDEVSVSGK